LIIIFICTFVTALQLLTDLNKGKCMHIILLRNNRIVSYEALVFEKKEILHLKEIMKTKSFEAGSMENYFRTPEKHGTNGKP